MIKELQREVEDRISEIRPYLKDCLYLYFKNYLPEDVKAVKYSVKFLDFPNILFKNNEFWLSKVIPKPSLDDLERCLTTIRRDKDLVETNQSFDALREERDKVLRYYDHMFLSDYKFQDQGLKKDIMRYRQFLRDLPSMHNSTSIKSATVPTFTVWCREFKG
jgi:hypothetical protein